MIEAGTSAPLGATVHSGAVNFSVFVKSATALELLLFDDVNAAQPSRVIPPDPKRHRSNHYWHVLVPGLEPGQERRTQKGNNNAYCQDSGISSFDWSLLERHADIHGS